LNTYRMKIYIGTELADGSMSIEAESLAEAEANAQMALKGTWITMDDEQGVRRTYCSAAATGFAIAAEDGSAAKRKISLLS